jgi:tetratricopeptide (TPR) repeat protein
MPLFRRPAFDRVRLLEAADNARRKGRRRRAARLYREVLAVEPQNPELHARLAPLLAGTCRQFDAWRSYRTAIRHCIAQKQIESACKLARSATRTLSRTVEPWEQLARLERDRGRPEAALQALREGRRALRGRRRRPEAIHLLRLARQLAPDDGSIAIDLARLLARDDQTAESIRLLERLAEEAPDARGRRAARAALWRIEPSLLHTGAWIGACIACWRDDPLPPRAGTSRAGS